MNNQIDENEFETIKKSIIEEIQAMNYEYDIIKFDDSGDSEAKAHTRETMIEEIKKYILTRFL